MKDSYKTNFKNRVELHCHTSFSKEDGSASIGSIVDFAKSEGMQAVAFTDHGNVSAYTEIQNYCKYVKDFKPIYGMEAYVVNDLVSVGENLDKVKHLSMDTDVVVVDLETTGFSPEMNEIIEIGAVKINGGKITDKFETYVKPNCPIPGKIHNLTGIGDLTVQDAPSIDVALPEFIDFVNGAIIVAHNAPFDISFLTEKAGNLGIDFQPSSIDTLILSRMLLPRNDRYRLDVVAETLNVTFDKCHRALDDCMIAAEIYLKLIDMLKNKGISTIEELINMASCSEDLIKRSPTYHVSILAKNMAGIETIYKLVTDSNMKYFYLNPRIKLSDLLKNRENLLLGSACSDGLLGQYILACKRKSEIEAMAGIFDYLEVQPIEEMLWMIKSDKLDPIYSKDDLISYNNQIISLGEKLGKPVVATGDVHFLRPENSISRAVLRNKNGFTNPTETDNLYFRTTEEMLEAFNYLDEEKAYEIVVENTNKIADQIEAIKPLYHEKLPYYQEGDYERLEALCVEALGKLLKQEDADFLQVLAPKRLSDELDCIKANNSAYMYLYFYELINRNKLNPAQYSLRGTAASSFVCYLLGISQVNPLSPDHFLYSEFLMGINGDKMPDININIDEDVWSEVIESLKSLSGVKNAYRAGTIATFSDEDIEGMIVLYEDEEDELTNVEKAIIREDLKNVFKRRGVHPGGMMVVPTGVDELKYCPFGYDDNRENQIQLLDYHYLDHIFDKVDILCHDCCTLNSRGYRACGYYPTDKDLHSEELLSLMTSCEALGIKHGENHGIKTGMLGIYGYTNDFMIMLLDKLKPRSVADLIKLKGIGMGTDTWLNNGEILFAEGKANLSNMIGCREDIYEMMISCGIDKETALAITKAIRMGKMRRETMDQALIEEMYSHNVPEWFIESCKIIKYLFPRAHAAEYVHMELVSLYYKLYYPNVYYPEFFDLYGNDKFKEYYAKGEDGFKELDYYIMADKDATAEDMYMLKVWNEYRLRAGK